VSALRSREFKNSAKAYSVQACICGLDCGKCADLESELSESCGCIGKFLPLAELHSLFHEKVLPCLPARYPEGSFKCDGEHINSNFYRASGMMHWEAPCIFPFHSISSSHSWLLSSTEPKWIFNLVDFVFPGSSTLTRRWNLICPKTSMLILFTQ